MNKQNIFSVRIGLILWATLAFVLFSVGFEATAQTEPRFFTKSQGARDAGLAQVRARLTQAEADVDAVESSVTALTANWTALKNMSDTCADAFANGSNDDLILFWDVGGGAWNCGSEIDPTVQSWAKSALPTCTGSQVLSVSGGDFSCVENAGATIEVDPHVRAFADSRQTLLTCSEGNVLTSDGTDLSCTANSGSGVESDPTVKSYAKSDLPTCAMGQVLKSNGSSFSCVADAGGSGSPISLAGLSDTTISGPSTNEVLKWSGSAWVNGTETDPNVVAWAKTGITGGTAGACNADQVLTADDTSALDCTDISTLVGSNLGLGDLADVTISSAVTDNVLAWNGSAWVNAVETDPLTKTFAKTTLPTCTGSQLLTGNGTALSCADAASTVGSGLNFSDLGDTNITTPADNSIITWDSATSKWVDEAGVKTFAQTALPSCGATQVLTGNGTALSCTSAATAVGNGLNLSDLGDTNISVGAGQDGYALTWDNGSGNWVAAVPTAGDADTLDSLDSLQFVRSDASDSLVGDYDITGTLSTTSDLTVDTTTLFVDASTNQVGIGTATPTAWAQLHVQGNALATGGVTSDDYLRVRNAGTDKVKFNGDGSASYIADGSFGIGTTTPNATLDVIGAVSATTLGGTLSTAAQPNVTSVGTLDSLTVTGDITADTNTLKVDAANNRVGVGTIAPSVPLHVVGAGLFTGTVTAADPTLSTHLTTKSYVDSLVGGQSAISQGDSAVTVTDLGTGVVTVDVDNETIVSYRNGGTTFDQGYIKTVSGTATVPSLAFIDDADTGPFLAADGEYAIATGGTERLRVDSAGKLGIGTSNPAYNLDVVHDTDTWGGIRVGETGVSGEAFFINHYGGTGSGTQLLQEGDMPIRVYTNGSERMRIDGDGNVGIGTTAPTEKLDVAGNIEVKSAGDDAGLIGDDGTGTTIFSLTRETNDVKLGGYAGVQLWYGATADVGSGTAGLVLNSSGNVGIATAAPTATLDVSGTVAVATSLTVNTDALTVNPAGNGYVGIGTASPTEELSVAGDIGLVGEGNGVRFNMYYDGAWKASEDGYGASIAQHSSSGALNFGTTASSALAGAGNSVTTRMTLLANGNVGIGTTTPNALLDVAGNISASMPTLASHVATKQYVDEQVGGSSAISEGDSGVTVTDLGTGVIKVNVDGDDIFSYRNTGTTVDQGPVFFQAGSAANPGISFNGDPNTGIYGHGADDLGFSVGGSLVARMVGTSFRAATGTSAGAPFYTVVGDIDTGMFFPGANELAFSTGGSEMVRIDDAGYVGIGTTNPANKLHILGTGTEDGIRVVLDASNNILLGYSGSSITHNMYTSGTTGYMALYDAAAEKIRFNAGGNSFFNGGNVGIGTTSPATALDVSGTTTVTGTLGATTLGGHTISLDRAGANYLQATDASGQLILGAGGSGGTYEALRIKGAKVGIGGVSNPSTSLDVSGTVTADAFVGDGSGITGLSVGSITAPGDTGALLFNNADAISATATTDMFYDSTNKVLGLGTATPTSSIPDSGGWSSTDAKFIAIKSATNTGDVGLFMRRSDGATGVDIWSNSGNGDVFIDNRWNSDGGDVHFRTKTSGTAVDAMTILGSGQVGIGTTAPAAEATLDVSGTIKVAGNNSETCDADHRGMIRYNSVTGTMQMCRP